MDDGWRDYRRNKPQQKLYKPGSGPLRRSGYSLDKMNSFDISNGVRSRDENHYGSKRSLCDDDMSISSKDHGGRPKKPEQQLYVPRAAEYKPDNERHSNHPPLRTDNLNHYNRRNSNHKIDKSGYNSNNSTYSRDLPSRRDRSYADGHVKDNRSYRQVSEPRSMSPSHSVNEVTDRNRDTRSMEMSSARHNSTSGGKPPSGRRNSAGYPTDLPKHKYTLNVENLPPRLKKKYLEKTGHHSFDNNDHQNRDKYSSNHSVHTAYDHGPYYNQATTWSQTLPSRGRGRLKDNENFDREKFLNTYLKSCDLQSSRHSTPSSSHMNLYETNAIDSSNLYQMPSQGQNNQHKDSYSIESKNGVTNSSYNHQIENNRHESDSDQVWGSSTNLTDFKNLDWTEEVEKSIKINDDDTDTEVTSPLENARSGALPSNNKIPEPKSESRESKRSGRAKRRDKRSSSRGQNSDRKCENKRRDSEQELAPPSSSLKQKDRERRDSHRSNRSSTIGNSRDDLDKWRSLRSFSREQSTERHIVSQCNSRDTSSNRGFSSRDNDGFRIPAPASKNIVQSGNQKKSTPNGRGPSTERDRQSPLPEGGGGGGRRSKKRSSRRKGRGGGGEGRGGGGGGGGGAAASGVSVTTAAPAPAHGHSAHGHSTNWREEILENKKHTPAARLDRHQEVNRHRLNSIHSDKSSSETSTSHPGLLILPQGSMPHIQKERGREGSIDTQKTLFDHHNPSKPIIVQTNVRADSRMERGCATMPPRASSPAPSEATRALRHRALLQQVDRADVLLRTRTLRGPLGLAAHWPDVTENRKFLQNALHKLLMSDLKYCLADNIEQHFWKILYYSFIEELREGLSQASPEDKPKIVNLINTIIEEGNIFFENLIKSLEKTYKFHVDDYINDSHLLPLKGLGYIGLALISVQKLYVYLGDLARYKEQVNGSSNYAKSKYWYTRAQHINPKNGRPYNQLAILAIYARRKLDAVFYYMRSLMSSNPFNSAKESLISLFDENRKKYEAAERKRRVIAESSESEVEKVGGGLRREIWVRPSGARTTTLRRDNHDHMLANMTPVELNKSFITSYLHVHGKLVTKIGMETFHESSALMLRQFRALLSQQPLSIPAVRLLQLTALNMFAVETTANSNQDNKTSGRSPWLECALGVSLLMFGAMLERCCALLPEPNDSQQHVDALLLLPAIKVWSDWMLCHHSVWNPPPSFDSFDFGSDNDPWDWLAKLMNTLEALDDKSIVFETDMKEGYNAVRLPEDAALAGFTPLMYMEPATAYVSPTSSPTVAEYTLRTRKLLFFGTEYLVGLEPPVLGLEYPPDAPPRYISAVQRSQPAHLPLQDLSEDSQEEEESRPSVHVPKDSDLSEATDETTRRMLRRKEQLEVKRANLELREQRVQELLRGELVSVEVEVRPRWLVPDTNCFIDHLALLQRVLTAPSQPYLLAVPLVVITELEGLSRCDRLGSCASSALSWLRETPNGLRFATSKGTLLATPAFTAERETERSTNDDKVLATAVNLHTRNASEPDAGAGATSNASAPVRRVREVVLLTDDRNLRVKALAAELPARDLPSFVTWAALPDTSLASDDTRAGDVE